MRGISRFLMALTVCVFTSTSAFAQPQGTLTLSALFEPSTYLPGEFTHHWLLTVTHELVPYQDTTIHSYQGTIVRNGVPDVVSVTQLFNGWRVSIGINGSPETYDLIAFRSATSVVFEGTLTQGRLVQFFGTYKANRDVWLYDGTVGAYEDFTGKGQVDQLNLSWNKSKLVLRSTGNGGCDGQARVGGTVTHVFTCETTGSLTDAFFVNPDQVLMWLVNLYAK